MEKNLKVIDAISDRPWRTTFLSQGRTVYEDVFAGDVLDVDPHGRDAFNEVLTSDIFRGCPGHDRAEVKDRQTVSCQGLGRLVLCCLGEVLGDTVCE